VDDAYVKLDCVISIEHVGCILPLLHNNEGEMWKGLFGVVGLVQAWQACDIYIEASGFKWLWVRRGVGLSGDICSRKCPDPSLQLTDVHGLVKCFWLLGLL
jgi:hypothetical protein